MSVPLRDLDAERGVLMALLVAPRRLLDVEYLRPEDFTDSAHRAIWQAMVALAGQDFDALMLRAQIRSTGQLTEAVSERLADLEASCLSAANLEVFAGIVAERGVRRRLAAAAERIGSLATAEADDVRQLVDQAEQALFDVEAARAERRSLSSHEAVSQTLAYLVRIRQGGELAGVTTGLPSLDARTTGMHPSELWVLAARPGVGKSALATEIALAAADTGVGVLYWSLEMRVEELVTRAICASAKVPLSVVRAGRLSDDDMCRLTQAAERVDASPIHWNTSTATITTIRSEARRLKAREPNLGLIIVDYLGLVDGSGSRRSQEARHLEVAEISRGLKLLAGELGVTVLALSQISRDVEKSRRRPYLSDLRESGAVEQDANVVLFLHPASERDAQTGAMRVELIVAKQRNGPTGILPITFQSQWTGFEDGGWEPSPPPPSDADAPPRRTFAERYRKGRAA